MFELNINNKVISTDLEGDTPLLWLLRDELNLTGTKFGCGIGQCGACTVHLNGEPVRACSLPISAIGKSKIVTIEGANSAEMEALQSAWLHNNVSQCGYCQVGQLMSAASLLNHNKRPNDEQIETAMAGNICRCGTYPRIKQGIKEASESLAYEVN